MARVIDIRKPHWLAAYTKPRNEKKVYQRLVDAGYETFLPLQKKLKQWSDRKKIVEEPLLRSYIFVRITEKEYYYAIRIPGMVRYVTFEGKAAPIPDKQIDILKMLVGQQVEIEATDEIIEPGERVEIRFGTMTGFEGELVKHKGKNKVIIKLDHVSHLLLVTLPANYIAKAIKE
jgi:transcription antitermination factor NusG